MLVLLGKMVHQLAARAIIRDWETNAILHTDKSTNEVVKKQLKHTIIQLSKRHQVITPFTSFLAVEKREKVGRKSLLGPSYRKINCVIAGTANSIRKLPKVMT